MPRLALSLPLLLLLFACSANDSAPNKRSPDAAVPGEEGDEGQAEIPDISLPDPGKPPVEVSGIVSLDYLQEGSGAAKLQASAIFTSPPQSLASSQFQDLLSRYEAVPLDECVSLPVFNVSGGQANPLDAGELTLIAPDDSRHSITRTDFAGFVFYGGDLPDSAFEPASRYRLETTGAMVPAFSGEFWTPSDLRVKAPVATGPLSVERDKPLDIVWEGAPDGHPVIVRIQQTKTTVTCRLTDDGAFTIPAKAFAFFSPSGAVDRGNDDTKDSLTIERFTWYAMGEGQSTTLALTSVGAKYEVSFQ